MEKAGYNTKNCINFYIVVQYDSTKLISKL